MEKFKVIVNDIPSKEVLSKYFAVASECCSTGTKNKFPEVTFFFGEQEDAEFFLRMVKNLNVFKGSKIS